MCTEPPLGEAPLSTEPPSGEAPVVTKSLPGKATPAGRPLHRIAEVRKQQGMSLRTVARHMNSDVRQVRNQELPTTDLSLTELYGWQDALGVPVAELLVESSDPLSSSVQHRAQMIKVMKTAAAIRDKAESVSLQRLTETLIGQLLDIMPELEGVNPWPTVGQRRSLEDYGQAAYRRVSGDTWQSR